MRKITIAGNWKMNTKGTEGAELIKSIIAGLPDELLVNVLIFPPAIHLAWYQTLFDAKYLEFGSQTIHWAKSGAYTGEFAPDMLLEVNCKWVLIGHSERRQYFGETDDTVNKRLLNTLESTLSPIVCVGETLDERESNQTFDVLERQLTVALKNVNNDNAKRLVIAYEPVWAIGTGLTATADQAQDVHKFIRDTLADRFTQELADGIVVQYGGSVKSSNAMELLSCPDVDGALIGGASLNAEEFIKIIEIAGSIST